MKAGATARTAVRSSRAAPAGARTRIAYSVGRLERAVRRELSRLTRRFGLTVAQYTALSVLRARGEVSNAQLARRSFVSPQAMNELIQAMAGKALLAREPHREHGRIVTLRLTSKGERVLAECDAGVERFEHAMLGRLSEAERAQFQALLRACIEALEARKPDERAGGVRARGGAS